MSKVKIKGEALYQKLRAERERLVKNTMLAEQYAMMKHWA